MRPQKQKNRHRPSEGLYGDCHRTCVAMILDMDRDDVPNWGEMEPDDGGAFRRLCDQWLREQGFASVHVGFSCTWEELGAYMLTLNPGVYYILGGESRTGVNHSVVAANNTIVADPSLTDAGIVGPCDDGLYWITTFTPIAFTVQAGFKHDPDYVGLTEDVHG